MDLSAKQVWDAALGQLQVQVTRPSYETWFKGTTGLALHGDELTVGAPSPFVAEMLEQRMYSLIAEAVERVAKRPLEVRFQVVNGDAPPLMASRPAQRGREEARPRAPIPAWARDIALNHRYTFDTFIVGKSNELAHAAATAVAQRPGQVYNPLVIYSDVGLGKTHLLHAIGHQVRGAGLSVIYATTEEFTNQYIRAIREGRTEEFREHYRSTDVLLLDDIQFLIGKEQTQEGFFHTFNALHMTNRQIVITSDRPVSALTLLEDRIRSRLSGGLVVDIQPPDLETRLAILRAKAEFMGIQVPDEVVAFLGERVHRNIRELEGSLNRVVAFAQLYGEPITVDLVRRALADALGGPADQRASEEEVLEAVADYFQVSPEDIRGRRRDKRTALARQVAMYLLREEARLSSPAIGRFLGGKDHTTVLHACQRIANQLNVDPHLRRDILNIREALQR